MESEKVKEIKKALECCGVKECCTNCPYETDDGTNPICISNLSKDSLTLINELESENDCKDIEISKQEYQIKQLKDRIAELEKENAIKTDTIIDLLNKQEIYEKEKLTKFAERLKEEFIKSANIQDSITAKKLFRDICPVKVDKVLKKTLKEFINE